MEETPVPFKPYFPKLSMSSYFWIIIGISGIFFGILGYFIGFRVNELPFSSAKSSVLQPPQSLSGDDTDSDSEFAEIFGTFTTDTSYYDQIDVYVDSIKNGVKTQQDADYRYITKPESGVVYPFSFQRLAPSKNYIFTASACTTNPKTYALLCAKHIKITKCSGTLQGNACIITGSAQNFGKVDFSLSKADNPFTSSVPKQ